MPARLWRGLLFVCGTLCVVLGVVGIFLPLMPTTVFLLMAAACYARSSDRFYRRLVEHRWLGPYIHQRRGLTTRQKATILSVLWIGLAVSMIWSVEATWIRAILALIGIGVTAHVARLPVLSGVVEPHRA